MNMVIGEIYNIYHTTDKTVIQLIDGRLYRCHIDSIRYFLQKYAEIGMVITLYVKDNEIQTIDIKL